MFCKGGVREIKTNNVGGKAPSSDGSLQEHTPDTDDSQIDDVSHPLSAHTFSSAPTKCAPVMGNRGLQHRGKKARTYPPKEHDQKVIIIFFATFIFTS